MAPPFQTKEKMNWHIYRYIFVTNMPSCSHGVKSEINKIQKDQEKKSAERLGREQLLEALVVEWWNSMWSSSRQALQLCVLIFLFVLIVAVFGRVCWPLPVLFLNRVIFAGAGWNTVWVGHFWGRSLRFRPRAGSVQRDTGLDVTIGCNHYDFLASINNVLYLLTLK